MPFHPRHRKLASDTLKPAAPMNSADGEAAQGHARPSIVSPLCPREASAETNAENLQGRIALLVPSNSADRDLERRIMNFLYRLGQHGFGQLDVEARSGEVLIAGCVSTDGERRVAEMCCQRVAGVLRVINEVRVLRSSMLRADAISLNCGEWRDCS